ncbi:MAG: hypothetical protein ASARMPREDX12_002335 [Alectoria sarmentosa]|nr:MAG: hypothetical protein ASARMPREDX12_002335 [Alectoria sarmentosa]
MVQGLPAVDWKKPENNAKLFAAVLALIPGTPDYKKIAAVFGTDVPASAISYRLNVVRKEGAALGLTPGSGSFSAPAKTNGNAKRTAHAAKKNQSKEKRKRGGILNNDLSDDSEMVMKTNSEEESAAETDDEKSPTTPATSAKRQKTMGGRASKRVSPRNSKKTDYKKLDDPFVTMNDAQDENGNNVFGEPSGTESEDTYATDGSFKDAVVKMEEAV